MADPLWINASSGAPAYTANELRQAMALALMYDGRSMGARSGVRPGGTQLQVSVAGSTITVQPGVLCIDPGLSTPQGPYWVAIPAAETPGPLTAADATNPRRDIVIARVYDHDEDVSGLRLARTEYVAGVANPSPSRPATPAGSVRLATIDVPKVGSGSAVVTPDYPYTVAAGAILPVRAAGDIAAGVAGRYRHRLDTGQLERDTGAAWIPIDPLLRRKLNDEFVLSNTTLHNDNELLLTVADASTIWSLEVYLRVLSPPSAGMKFKWTTPSGAVLTWVDVNSGRTELRETDTLAIPTSGGAENVTLRGTFSVGATPGTLRLQWAQNVLNAGTTAVQALSWMTLQRLP